MLFVISFLLTVVALAQDSTTVTWLGPGIFAPALDGSIVTACAGTTVLSVECASNVVDTSVATCAPNSTVIASQTFGPSFAIYSSTSSGPDFQATVGVSCSFDGTTSATCVQATSAVASGTSFTSNTTTMLAAPQFAARTATITAGASKLSGQFACSGNPNANSTGTDNTIASKGSSHTGAGITASTTETAASGGVTSVSSSTSTGGAGERTMAGTALYGLVALSALLMTV